MSFLEIISHFSPKYYIFLIFLFILIQLFCWLFQVIAKTSTLAQDSWALTFVMYTYVGFELSPANSIIFFQSTNSTFKSRTVWKTLTNRIEFYFSDNFKIRMGFGQKILETEMKNIQASPISEMKTAVILLKMLAMPNFKRWVKLKNVLISFFG